MGGRGPAAPVIEVEAAQARATRPKEAALTMERIGTLHRARLDNGLTVLMQENHHAPVVTVQVWVNVGSADENDAERGLAHLTEHMLFKGTKKRAVGEIAEAIESAGGEINAWTSFDHTAYHVVMASRFLDRGIEVLADAVQNSRFDAAELEREKTVVLEEIKRSRDLPSRNVGDLLFTESFRSHPYRHAILGTAASVSSYQQKDMKAFFRRHYHAANMTVLVLGDINPAATLKKMQRYFGAAPKRKPVERKRLAETPQRKLRVKLVRDDIAEAYFSLGWHIPAVQHEDVPALDTLALLLGQGASSRLQLQVKRGKNLVNDIYAYAYTPMDPGIFVVGGSCPPAKTLTAMDAALKEIDQMIQVDVSTAELAKAKSIIESENLYLRETVQGMARRLGYHQTLLDDPLYGEVYLGRVLSVTAEDLRRVAQTYLGRQQLTAAVYLPKNKATKIDTAKIRSRLARKAKAMGPSFAKATEGKVERIKLPKGPTLLIEEDHSNALVSIRAAFLGGVRYETAADNGINSFLAGMMNRGTETRSADQIARAVDAMAGSLGGFSGRNSFGLRADFPSAHFARGFDLFCDCLFRSSFPEAEIKRERELTLEDLRSREDNLSGLAFDLFLTKLYHKHPYRLPILGNRQSVLSFRRQQLIDYAARRYTPENMVLSIVGDVDTEQVKKLVSQHCRSASKRTRSAPPKISLEARPQTIRRAEIHRPKAQAHLVLGFMGTTFSSRDRHGLEVLLAVLTGQGGRIFFELRDRRSLAYAVSGFSLEGIEPGYIAFYLATDPARVDEAISALTQELVRLRKQPVSAKELQRAKRYLIGSQAIGLQRKSARATAQIFDELYGIGHLAHRKYPEHIQAVTREEIQRLARRYLDPKHYTLALVRPPPGK